MTSYFCFSQNSGGSVFSFADDGGGSRRNKKSLVLSALLSATALGVFLEGCGGGSGNTSGNTSGTPSGNTTSGTPSGTSSGDNRNVIRGNDGVNVISGSDGDDILYGLGDHDVLAGGAGEDILKGGDGNDRLEGGADADAFFGGEGIDTVSYRESPVASDGFGFIVNTLFNFGKRGDAEGDTFDSIENLEGSMGHDALSGDHGANDLYGLAGDDKLYGMGGNDKLYGGEGIDILLGGDGDDRLEGGYGDDKVLNGEAGVDTILGGAGVDQIDGGTENDILQGGTGADVYLFHVGDGKDSVREVSETEGEQQVANILRFVGEQYQFVTHYSSQGEVKRVPVGLTFERDATDLIIRVDARGGEDIDNEVVLEGYYTTQTGDETAYTIQIQYSDAFGTLHELSDLMAL